jgi:hypothetical protein
MMINIKDYFVVGFCAVVGVGKNGIGSFKKPMDLKTPYKMRLRPFHLQHDHD